MPSPFPGMDPYLESEPFCDDLRSTLVVVAHGELNQRLPRGYSAWIDRRENTHVMIKEVRCESVITLIEFLSPALKTLGPNRDGYLAKRNEYLATGTNLVEIDLHRTGRRMPMGKPKPPRADYYVQICRAVDFPKTGVWPFSVREALPDIPIPLNPEDGAVTLPLQACFNGAYDLGPHDAAVDYAKPPRIALHGEDGAWAKAIAKNGAHGR
jgi:hypothetical protein